MHNCSFVSNRASINAGAMSLLGFSNATIRCETLCRKLPVLHTAATLLSMFTFAHQCAAQRTICCCCCCCCCSAATVLLVACCGSQNSRSISKRHLMCQHPNMLALGEKAAIPAGAADFIVHTAVEGERKVRLCIAVCLADIQHQRYSHVYGCTMCDFSLMSTLA